MILDEKCQNNDVFRECLSGPLIERSALTPLKPEKKRLSKGRKNDHKALRNADSKHDKEQPNDAEDLADFIDYLATEIYTSFPPELRTLSYSAIQNDRHLAEAYAEPLSASTAEAIVAVISPSVCDSLEAYALLQSSADLHNLLYPVIQDYISTVTAPPPIWSNTRASACEICERSWIPLTYHHLIPKQVHAKAIKRGWHEEWRLNSVAWLCRACHSFVHRVASNEELAKEWWSVERLMDRDDVQAWAKWVGRVRWKAR